MLCSTETDRISIFHKIDFIFKEEDLKIKLNFLVNSTRSGCRMFREAICITLGEQSENHAGMKMYGDGLSESGYSIKELEKIKKKYKGKSELIRLNDFLNEEDKDVEESCVLILRKGVDVLLEKWYVNAELVYDELMDLEWDKKYYDTRRQKVLNKRARWNLCFGEKGNDEDYENKIGRVVSYDDVVFLSMWKKEVERLVGEDNLECEGNRYYNLEKCGIGYHGDGERKKVIGANFGASREIVWIWYERSERISEKVKVRIENGDMYIMSEKASGYDWKKRSKKTLRHAAGCEKYIK